MQVTTPLQSSQSQINTSERWVYFNATVAQDSIAQLLKDFNKIKNEENTFLNKVGYSISSPIKFDPITLFLNSNGGECYSAFAGYDIINNTNTTVVAYGSVMSAGVILLLGGKYRTCYPNTTFMIHDTFSIMMGSLKEFEEHVEQTTTVRSLMFKIISSKTLISEKQLLDICNTKKDTYFNAKEALKLGIVHEIIES